MKTLLLFPPLWSNFYPYLSLPVLTAYLKQRGHDVEQWDVNADFNKECISVPFLERCSEIIKQRMNTAGDENNIKAYRELEKHYLLSRYILDFLPDALITIKEPEKFYDPVRMSRAQTIINSAYTLITRAYSCFESLKGFEMIYANGANYSFNKMMPLLDDNEKNLLVGYYDTKIIPGLLKREPDVVGISITSYSQLVPAMTLAKQIKKNRPSIHIIAGGNVVTRIEHLIKHDQSIFEVFDTAITHEGEEPLHSLLESLKNGSELSEVPNLIYVKNGEPVFNQKYKFKDINILPAPDFTGFNLSDYMAVEHSLPMYATRGCYWNRCTFCDHSLIYNDNYVQKKAEKIVDDLVQLSDKYNVKFFHFHDECIAPGLIRRISQEIVDRGVDLNWYLNIRAERQFDAELTSLMYRAGCRMVSIGVESFNKRTLDRMDKGSSPENINKVLKNFSDAGILTHGFIIIGFPGETIEDADDTINFIKDNSEILHLVGVSKFSLGVKSKIAQNFTMYPIVNLSSNVNHELSPDLNYNIVDGMTKEEIDQGYNRIKEILMGNDNNHLFLLKNRISVFLYSCKYGTGNNGLKEKSKNAEQPIDPRAKKYRLNNGVYYGRVGNNDGIPIYNFVTKNKISTKDSLLCTLINTFDRGEAYTSDETYQKIKNLAQNNNGDSSISKVRYYLDYLVKKNILTKIAE